MLFCLTLVRTLTGASVHHDVHQDGVERHDPQTTPAHSASDGQGRDVEPSLLTSTGSVGPHKGEEGPSDPRSLLLSLSLVLLLFLRCNLCFPFYRPGESTGYSGEKEENERESRRPSGSLGPSSPSCGSRHPVDVNRDGFASRSCPSLAPCADVICWSWRSTPSWRMSW